MDEKDIEKLQREAYRLYQLDWMAAHGYSAKDLAVAVLEWLERDDFEAIDDFPGCYDDWAEYGGFDSEIWACFNEFLDAEYRDEAYMSRLLPTKLFEQYKAANAKQARKD